MSEEEQGLAAGLEYNTDLFDDGTIERMLGHLQRLLEGIVADPDRRLSELPLLSEAERHRLLSSGTTRQQTIRGIGACTSCSRSRSNAHPTPSRWSSRSSS